MNGIIRTSAPIVAKTQKQQEEPYHRIVTSVGKPVMELKGRWYNYELSRQQEIVLDDDFVCLGFTHTFPSNSTNLFDLRINGESPFTIRAELLNSNYIPTRIWWPGADYITKFSIPYYMPRGTRITFKLTNADSDVSHQFSLCGYTTQFPNEFDPELYPKPHILIAKWDLETGVDDNSIVTIPLERNADFIFDKIHSYALWDLDNYNTYGITWGIGSYSVDIKVDGVGLFLNRPTYIRGVAGSLQVQRPIYPDIRIPRGSKLSVEASWRIADTSPISPNEQKYHYFIFHGYDVKQ